MRSALYDPVAHLRIHPRQLNARLTRSDQTVDILMDAEARAVAIRVDDLLERGVKRSQRPDVSGQRNVCTDGFDIPKLRVDGVVFGRFAGIREVVWQHSAIDIACECLQDLAGESRAPGRERESGQRNHRVAAPVAEPVIACDDRTRVRVVRKGPAHDELIGGEDELPNPCRRRFGTVRLEGFVERRCTCAVSRERRLTVDGGIGLGARNDRQAHAGL